MQGHPEYGFKLKALIYHNEGMTHMYALGFTRRATIIKPTIITLDASFIYCDALIFTFSIDLCWIYGFNHDCSGRPWEEKTEAITAKEKALWPTAANLHPLHIHYFDIRFRLNLL